MTRGSSSAAARSSMGLNTEFSLSGLGDAVPRVGWATIGVDVFEVSPCIGEKAGRMFGRSRAMGP